MSEGGEDGRKRTSRIRGPLSETGLTARRKKLRKSRPHRAKKPMKGWNIDRVGMITPEVKSQKPLLVPRGRF